MNIESVKAAYRRWARIYDVVFGPIFHPGRRHVVEALGAQPGERVLEVGVGTGLSLPLYPRGVKLTGIDISREMLDVAERRVERDGIREDVEAIREMDAEAMDFPDDAFDRVVAMYVVSTVPDYHRLVREMRRVCKPGGDLYIVNHFQSENAIVGGIEGALAPIAKYVGFHPDFRMDTFLAETGLEATEVRPVNLGGYWKVLHCPNPAD
ncbi:MAG: class I SAM-dependent methyltransferase [Thiohalospira sp.]|uniref:class I SAM-dependent methyltransferase n=1 Tax=Thiohalospira sp. TaxID=3080549 RepID=UPI00397ECE9D